MIFHKKPKDLPRMIQPAMAPAARPISKLQSSPIIVLFIVCVLVPNKFWQLQTHNPSTLRRVYEDYCVDKGTPISQNKQTYLTHFPQIETNLYVTIPLYIL